MKVYCVAALYSPKGKRSGIGSQRMLWQIRKVDIKEIKEIPPEESNDPMVKYLMSGGNK